MDRTDHQILEKSTVKLHRGVNAAFPTTFQTPHGPEADDCRLQTLV